jgi:hypothetical protein
MLDLALNNHAVTTAQFERLAFAVELDAPPYNINERSGPHVNWPGCSDAVKQAAPNRTKSVRTAHDYHSTPTFSENFLRKSGMRAHVPRRGSLETLFVRMAVTHSFPSL